MANQGNQGAVQLVKAIQEITKKAPERTIDFGEIKSDYSLVTDSYPIPIPRGDWSVVKQLRTETGNGQTVEVRPGMRVVVIWVGNEAVVIGELTRI